MFNTYIFILESADDFYNTPLEVEFNPLTMIVPLSRIDVVEGEESEVMAEVMLAFVEELNKKFNILGVYEKS